ncbi:hypothetical protein [Streptomyces sp. NPDC048521]|uniref:hypothetical protein n=1 Tax=Streptomyces sp. NPDC048521 TaxID=3365566 RepID=UPI0037234F73
MDLDRTPSQIANAAADEIRTLNHRTLDPKVFTTPSEVADTLNALTRLLQTLPQSLQQLEAGLELLDENQQIRLDNKPKAETSRQDIFRQVLAVRSALQQARERLGQADEAMREAARPLSRMGAPWPPADGED